MKKIVAISLLAMLLCPLVARADDDGKKKQPAKITSAALSGIKLRAIGPALMSGRISDVAIDPVKPNTWYVAAGSGNLWKTENAGTTWKPIFDNYGSYSIGCVTIDPNNRHIIWVGSGEDVGGRHVGYGDGVYRSLDGGKSFKNLGLKKSQHIAKILVDPRNSKVVYVACQGPLWSKGGERGLYKSIDSGASWKQILAKGPYTGVTDVAFDPRDADIVFAVTHQRHRTVASLINGGPESGIYKSVDGGKNWRQLKSGLPGQDKGKIAIAVSPLKPDVVYATIELAGRTGGFWRSTDCGETWTKMSDYAPGGTGPHYYQEIFADPHRFDVVYQANVRMGRTEDGGKTWKTVESPWKHVDNHAVGFHPADPDFLLVGCDGGIYRSYDYAKTFSYCANLPLTQFYKLSIDNEYPIYNVVGGTQDNNTQYGPSRTNNIMGIRNSDWITTIGGDGHDCAIDPKNPNIIYCESQKGFLRRYDRRTGQSIDIQPQPPRGEEELRFNWDSPIFISPHDNHRLYFGSKKLHRSDDRGDSWRSVSGDLSRNDDRFKLKVMDRVWSIDAIYDLYAMSHYGNITSISESPLKEGLIYVGTDDGLIQITQDGGKNWRKIDRIPGVPEFSFVNDIKADLHDPDTVYAVFDRHKAGDFKPYIVMSTNRGKSWKSIAGNLPERHIVWRVVQDHVKKDLLFAGTEFGLFFTLDDGKKWVKLRGNVPNIPFRDLEIQQRENDLVGATFGRGFYILDDYSPLRSLSEGLLTENELVLFPVKNPLLYVPRRALGSSKGTQGDSFYTAANPSFGAVFTYYMRDTLKTRKQKRQEKEAQEKNNGGNNIYPGFDKLKQEEREENPAITFTITDKKGNVINRINGPATAGFHRIAWNLRYAPFTTGNGPLVVPGTYRVSAHKRVDEKVTPLGKPQKFNVITVGKASMKVQDRKETLAYQMKVGRLLQGVVAANGNVTETLEQLVQIKNAIKKTLRVDGKLYDEARVLERKLMDVRDVLSGDTTRSSRSQTAPLSISRRVGNALSGTLNSTYGPTKTHRREYEIGLEQYRETVEKLNKFIEDDFAKLKRKLDKSGVPWTSGRSISEIK